MVPEMMWAPGGAKMAVAADGKEGLILARKKGIDRIKRKRL